MGATYNESGVTYNDVRYRYNGTLLVSTATLQMRARIAAPNTSTLDLKARIHAPRLLQMLGRIARRQGWPIPGPMDPTFDTFQPTQLDMRARIPGPQPIGSQSFQALARIFHGATPTLDMRGRIVLAATLSMRAKISGQQSQHLPFTYWVQSDQVTRLKILFYTEGAASAQRLQMGARIAAVSRKRFTGYFLVAFTPVTTGGVQALNFGNSQNYQQTMAMRTFIRK